MLRLWRYKKFGKIKFHLNMNKNLNKYFRRLKFLMATEITKRFEKFYKFYRFHNLNHHFTIPRSLNIKVYCQDLKILKDHKNIKNPYFSKTLRIPRISFLTIWKNSKDINHSRIFKIIKFRIPWIGNSIHDFHYILSHTYLVCTLYFV